MKRRSLLFGLLALTVFSLGSLAVSNTSFANDPTVVNAADASTYWSSVDTSGQTTGNTFRKSLQDIMKAKGTKLGSNSYKGLNDILAKSDADPKDSSKVIPFYRSPSESVSASWNSVINKEHTWPNSRGAGEAAGFAGTDPQVVRPTLKDDNSNRGNSMYAESGAYDPASLGYPAARGEAARIILYAATMYYNKSTSGAGGTSNGDKPLELTNNVADGKDNHTMGKLSDLLKWNSQYPVTDAEIRRNNYLSSINYPRNPFIDHPEWANFIWDNNGIRESSIDPTSSYEPISTSIDSTPAGTKYSMITDTRELVIGNHYAVAALNGTSYVAMKNQMKATYYVDAVSVNVQDGVLTPGTDMADFVLEEGNGQGTFALHESKIGCYLNGVVSGTHNNVGYTDSGAIKDTDWTITASNGGFAIKSGNGVYPSYYADKADFTGTKSATTLYIFERAGGSTPSTSSSSQVSSNESSPLHGSSEQGGTSSGCGASIMGCLAISALGLGGLGFALLRKRKK